MAEPGEAPPLVLLVDDAEDNREVYEQFLTFSGFRVEIAVDGVEAIEKAKALNPDVIVMDLSLPRLDGWEATRRIKHSAATSHIPVIALTGHAVSESKRKALDAGCSGYLTKPCLPEILVSEIRRLL
jgi:two-component system, cell cycle response regulator DivK